jgi:hypothetical protein
MSRMPSIRRSLLAAALALTATAAATAPAHAAGDGTSNTIMFAEAVRIDPAHHQAVVRGPSVALPVGRHLDTLLVRTPTSAYTLTNSMISGYTTAQSLSLNFTKVEFMDYTDDAALMEEDGIFWP